MSRKVPVGTCSGAETAHAAASERLQPSALRQQSKDSKSQALASTAAAQAAGLHIPVRLIFELHYLQIQQQPEKNHY